MNTFFKNWLTNQSCLLLFVSMLFISNGNAQCLQNAQGQFVTALGEPCVNTIITAVPFLRIAPDSRSAGMGDAGLATSADANALHFNASKLVFSENRTGISLTFTPWLKALDVNDAYLAYASGYHQLDENNTVGLSFRYFSLGDTDFSNSTGMIIDNGRPSELEINAVYAKKLSQHFSGAFGLKYIYSNLAAIVPIGGENISPGESIAVDLSMTYQSPAITVGVALTNLGQGITYTNSVNKDFIPTNLGVGVAWHKNFGNQHRFTLTTDFNKLLVPTPDPSGTDSNNDGIPDYKQVSVFEGVFGSFSDAPNGFSEELREISYSLGAELWLKDFIALRTGYFGEHETKGNRKYVTTGVGIKYKMVTLNGSYLFSTANQKNPLDNTFRISLLLNFGHLKDLKNS